MFDCFDGSSTASGRALGISFLLHGFLVALVVAWGLAAPAPTRVVNPRAPVWLAPLLTPAALKLAAPATRPQAQGFHRAAYLPVPVRARPVELPALPALAVQAPAPVGPVLSPAAPIVPPAPAVGPPTEKRIAPLEIQVGAFSSVAVADRPARRGAGPKLGAFESASAAGHVAGGRAGNGKVVAGDSGWGDATPAEPPPQPRGAVRTGGFSEIKVEAAPAARPQAPAGSQAFSGVEILFKPLPAYSDEARKRRIEGEVWLEVRFTRFGEVQVLRVIQPLGHGLDESAVQAAERIRFKPAQRDGQAVDSIAKIHITFQLAY